jgi:hypothetical protein
MKVQQLGLGSARCGSVPERARLGSSIPRAGERGSARLGSTLAREPARLGSRAIFSDTYCCII